MTFWSLLKVRKQNIGKVKKVLERLDAINNRLNLNKFKFAETDAEWFGFHLSQKVLNH